MMKLTNKIALEIALNAIENSVLPSWSFTEGENRLEVSKAEAMDKLAKMMEQLDKKASAEKKPTKRQMDAEQEAQILLDELRDAGKAMTVSDMIAELPSCAGKSNQKVSGLLRPMLGTKVERIEEKRKAYFKAIA
jgi:hypothetical protein